MKPALLMVRSHEITILHRKFPLNHIKAPFLIIKSHEITILHSKIPTTSSGPRWGNALGAMASSVQWRPSLALLRADLGALIPEGNHPEISRGVPGEFSWFGWFWSSDVVIVRIESFSSFLLSDRWDFGRLFFIGLALRHPILELPTLFDPFPNGSPISINTGDAWGQHSGAVMGAVISHRHSGSWFFFWFYFQRPIQGWMLWPNVFFFFFNQWFING